MKKFYLKKPFYVFFLFILLVISCNSHINHSNGLKNSNQKVLVISPQEFNNIMDSKEGIILDVRTPKEYNAERIKNAELINFLDNGFEEKINQLDKSKPIYIYCRSGNRSAKAADILSQNGFEHIYELDGGIKAWRKEGLPTEN